MTAPMSPLIVLKHHYCPTRALGWSRLSVGFSGCVDPGAEEW